MARIVEVDASMLDDVYRLESRFDHPPSRAAWARALNPPWYTGDRPAGYAVVEDGQMTGFIGTLFRDLVVDGRTHRVANVHGTMVLPGHEASGLRLIMHLIRMKDTTFTTFTPVRRLQQFVVRVGFTPIEDRMRILYPTPWPRGRRRSGGPDVLLGATQVRPELGEAGALLLAHHDNPVCHHLLLAAAGGRRCHVVYSRVAGPVAHGFVLHVSDPEVFIDHSHEIRRAVMADTGTRLVAVDARLLHNRVPPASADVRAGVRRMVLRGQHLDPFILDNLYTEFALLNSAGLPTVKDEIRVAVVEQVERLPPRPRNLVLDSLRRANQLTHGGKDPAEPLPARATAC